jgi:glycosyltransferase involved in cell wall biosynthesis
VPEKSNNVAASEPRVAVVHDKLWQYGGGERVALALRRLWPNADFFTSTYDPRIAAANGFSPVRATSLQRVPRLDRAHHYFLPFYDRAFRGLDLHGYDAVVSSSAMFAKSVRPRSSTPHVCYCHTPPRFLWDLRDEAIAELPVRRVVRSAVSAMAVWLRRVDRRAADGVDHFIANSDHVAERIRECYERTAEVIYPPVEMDPFLREFDRDEYVLVLARLFPYKRVDLAIEACNRLGLPLVVVGEGSDRARLQSLAGPTVTLKGWVDEEQKIELIGRARVLVAPQVEDFGIASVEAIAAGTPVLSLRAGGALEIVSEGVNGAFFDEQNADELTQALEAFDEGAYDLEEMRRSVARFAPQRFNREMRDVVARLAG